MRTLRDIGELSAIKRITRLLPRRADIICGAGDDCAVVRPGRSSKSDWLLTSDAVIEGVHFLKGTPPDLVGRKAIGRVLSDIAAMGGEPAWALIDLVAPTGTPVAVIDGIYRGATKLAASHNLAIVGGDMARGRVLELHVFAVGTVPRGKAVLRFGARLGDLVFVTGSLGGSRKKKHLEFEPRIKEGVFLRKWATSMIDISDGLASDIGHIAEMSGVGISLIEELIPLSAAAGKSIDRALFDGENFELLFTVPGAKRKAFMSAWKKVFSLKCSLIGVVTPHKGVIEFADTRKRLKRKAYQHFV
jgi:thiamine-monophosphate kinase